VPPDLDVPEDERLYELLAEWDERRSAGPEPTPETLCPDDFPLRERLREKIAAQKRLEARLGLDRTGPAIVNTEGFTPPPEIPGMVIEEELGRGAMGVVYRATQLALSRKVAIKVVLRGAYATEPERLRFRTEALATARIRHPNIVGIYDCGQAGDLPFLMLEYLEGGSLEKRLKGEPQAPMETAKLVRTLAGAVATAHAHGVVHRDLKPSNVLFTVDGTPKIADYGLAKLLDQDLGLTGTGQSPGTPRYMAPEQAGLKPYRVGPATDIYALGAILYEMLTGRPPFGGVNISETMEQVRTQDPVPPTRLQPKVPRDLETICLKCLEKDPARRYFTGEALADDLGRFLEGRPITARRVGRLGRAWRWCKRRPALAASLTSLVLVTVGAFTGILWQRSVAHRRDEQNLLRVIVALSEWYDLFSKRPELQQPEMGPVRKEFLVKAQEQFQQLSRELGDNPRVQQERIRAMIRVSQVHTELGEPKQAAEAIRLAINAAEKWLREDRDSAERQHTLCQALHWSLLAETDNGRAQAAYRRAEELYARSQPGAAGEHELRMLNAYNLGKRFFLNGRVEQAMPLLYCARDVGEVAAGQEQASDLTISGLGRAYSFIAEAEAGRKRRAEAEAAYRRSNDLFRRVFDRAPRGLVSLLEYCLSCQQLQNYLSAMGKYDEATQLGRRVCHLLEQVDKDGERPDYEVPRIRHRLTAANYQLELQHRDNYVAYFEKDKKRADREFKEMEGVCRRTVELADALQPIFPNDSELEYWNAASRFNLHQILVERGDPNEETRLLLERACNLMQSSLSKKPTEDRQKEFAIFQETRKLYVKKGT
jgi:hypothetical protein